MKEKMMKKYEKTKELVKNINKDTVYTLGYVIPIVIMMITVISGSVNEIRFIIEGGYSKQWRAIANYGLFGGYDKKFTNGTADLIFAHPLWEIIILLIIAEIVFIVIHFFVMNSSKVKKTFMIIDLLGMGIIAYFVSHIFIIYDDHSERMAEWTSDLRKAGQFGGLKFFVMLFIVSVIALFIWCIWKIEDCKQMGTLSLVMLLISLIVIPLFLLLLQNILPLVTGALAIIILIVLGFLAIKIIGIFAGGSDEGIDLYDKNGSYYGVGHQDDDGHFSGWTHRKK